MAAALLFLIGVAAVIGGAELVVRGGARLAARLGISPLIIGLTVVAIGTSFPELAVGIDAALQGNGALAVGNIAGTNTFNLLFILGLVAVIRPLPLDSQTIRFDLPFIIASAFVLFLMGLDGWLTTLEGDVVWNAPAVTGKFELALPVTNTDRSGARASPEHCSWLLPPSAVANCSLPSLSKVAISASP